MTPSEREQWIIDYMRERRTTVDVTDTYFIDDYVDATGAKSSLQFIGADICRSAGRDLGRLFKKKLLERWACGLPSGDASMGFPKWVYIYSLPKATT